MGNYVKNITSSNITLCDLNDLVLPPGVVINLLSHGSQAEINSSADVALCLANGYIQKGSWNVNRFIIETYNPSIVKQNINNVDVLTVSTISGYPSTCNQEFPIYVTAPLLLAADPTLALEAATKQYVDTTALTVARAEDIAFHAGNVEIGGDLLINGDVDILGILTAPNIITETIGGVADSAGNCNIDINCNLNLLRHTISNLAVINNNGLSFTITAGDLTINAVDILINADVLINGNLDVTDTITADTLSINTLTGAGTDCVINVLCDLDMNGRNITNANTQTGDYATRELDNLRNTAVNDDIIPNADDSRDLGSATLRFAEVRTDKVFGASGSGTLIQTYSGGLFGRANAVGDTLQATGMGSFAVGLVQGGATIEAIGRGSFVHGRAYTSGNNITSLGTGSLAGGYVLAGAGGACTILSSGYGSFAHGYSTGGTIQATQPGTFATGKAVGGNSIIEATNDGSFAFGFVNTSSNISASQDGAFAGGYCYRYSHIYATAKGSFAHGCAANDISTIQSTGSGAFAHGYAYRGDICSTSDGSFASGSARTTGSFINASGLGNLATGYSSGAGANTIQATGASNCFQFGQGINDTANSLQVGDISSNGTRIGANITTTGDIECENLNAFSTVDTNILYVTEIFGTQTDGSVRIEESISTPRIDVGDATLTILPGLITDTSGTIDFDDENLTTTGSILITANGTIGATPGDAPTGSQLEIGASSAENLRLYHDGTDSVIENVTAGSSVLQICPNAVGGQLAVEFFGNHGQGAVDEGPWIRLWGNQTSPNYANIYVSKYGQLIFGGNINSAGFSVDCFLSSDDIYYISGAGHGGKLFMGHNTKQTNDCGMIATYAAISPETHNLIYCRREEILSNYDFQHAASNDPHFIIHSGAGDTTEYISFKHDQTDGIITTGTGDLKLSPTSSSSVYTTSRMKYNTAT